MAARSFILVTQLLDTVLFPGEVLGVPKNEVATEKKTFGSLPLMCLHAVPPPSRSPSPPTYVGADPAYGSIRLVQIRDHQIMTNQLARFAEGHVALYNAIFWLGRKAISGHIDQLQTFDPAVSPVALGSSGGHEAEHKTVRLTGGVFAGRKIAGAQPTYPPMAREQRVSGSVLLSAEITKEGGSGFWFPWRIPIHC